MPDILELARECGACMPASAEDGVLFGLTHLRELERRIREDEREKAAKVCEEEAQQCESHRTGADQLAQALFATMSLGLLEVAAAIRRGGDHG